MAAKWIEQGWVSISDLVHLGWSTSAIKTLRSAVPEEDSGIRDLGKARDLAAANDWARDKGEPIVSSKALKSPRPRRKEAAPKPKRKPARKVSPESMQHRMDRAQQARQAQLEGKWFNSKKKANEAGFLSAKDLDARLWTESLIASILPTPDGFGDNYYGDMPARYWSKSIVLAAEGSEEFSVAMATSLKRRKISWKHGISSIGKSNLEMGFSGTSACLPWAVILSERF